MPKRQQTKASELKGMNIYQDPKHGTVLYDRFTKKGYQLTTSDVKWYGLSQAFLPVAIVLGYVLFAMVKLDIVPSIVISLIAYIVMRFIYRVKFLNTLPFVENYKPNDTNIFANAAKNYSKPRLLLLTILAVALIGVTIAYLISLNPQGGERIGMYILLVASIAMFGFGLISYIYKKNNN